MNNILSFSEYRQLAKVYEENLVKEQILKPIEEGIRSRMREKINRKAEIFVKQALAEEIEMGKKLNEEIQEAVDKLKEYIDKLEKEAKSKSEKRGDFFREVEKIFEDIRKSSFELLEILSGVEINFADYVKNATMSVVVNFGMLMIPIRSTFLLKKSYKYFIGLIKNTIRRDMLMLMLNFDQFENTVLIESLADDEQSKIYDKYNTELETIKDVERSLIADAQRRNKKGSLSEKQINDVTKVTREMKKTLMQQQKNEFNKGASIGFDTKYDNTYTKTLDQLKNFVLEDDTKYLESIKSGMRSLGLDEIDTKTYIELLISAAEECAYEVSAAIHTNFIDKVSVFKLANQKRLIELLKKEQSLVEEREKEFEEETRKKIDEEELKKVSEKISELGKKIFEDVVEAHEGNGEEQENEFEKIKNEKEKITEEKTYTKGEIFEKWLSLEDYKNWKENEEKIEPELKRQLSDMNDMNEESYIKCAETLVEILPQLLWKENVSKSGDTEVTFYSSGALKSIKSGSDKEEIKRCGFTLCKEVVLDTISFEIERMILKTTIEGEEEFKDPKTGELSEISKEKEKDLEKKLQLISENIYKMKETEQKSIIEIIEKTCSEKIKITVSDKDVEAYGMVTSPKTIDKTITILQNINRVIESYFDVDRKYDDEEETKPSTKD